jgi:nitric oxide reductase NorQ protein
MVDMIPTTIRSGSDRLGPGELRRQVAEVLAASPGSTRTANEISSALGDRSSGAVGNALAVLVDRGQAVLMGTNPRRYRATATTEEAARASGSAPAPARPASPVSATESSQPPAMVRVPVTRPNGQLYHPRMLADLPDVTALRRLREAAIPALLYGPPGTGKTALVEAAFPDLITVAGDGDTAVADLVGEYTQTEDGRYEFVHGPLVTAMT